MTHPYIFSNTVFSLEWKIVSAAICSRSCWLSWREWSSSTTCWSSNWSRLNRSSTHWRVLRSTRLHTTHSTSYGVRIYALHVPCANTVEPTTLILMSIQIEGNHDLFTCLNIELSNTVCAKNIKAQLLRICFVSFDNIRLSLPLASC